MTVDEALRHIRMARLPGKTTHERQQHILNAIEIVVVAIQKLEAEQKIAGKMMDGDGASSSMERVLSED